jgi:hypothetical protein
LAERIKKKDEKLQLCEDFLTIQDTNLVSPLNWKPGSFVFTAFFVLFLSLPHGSMNTVLTFGLPWLIVHS